MYGSVTLTRSNDLHDGAWQKGDKAYIPVWLVGKFKLITTGSNYQSFACSVDNVDGVEGPRVVAATPVGTVAESNQNTWAERGETAGLIANIFRSVVLWPILV